jgi:hypothetical protein
MGLEIGVQQAEMGAVGDEFKTATPPPLPPRKPLTPGQIVAGPDINQMQEAVGYAGWLRQALKKVKAAVGLQGPTL